MEGTAPIKTAGLRRFRAFESYDVDDTCDRISQFMKPHSLIPTGEPGRSKAVINLARFGGVTLSTIDFGAGMQVDAQTSSDYYSIIFCLRGHASAGVNGEALQMRSNGGAIGEPGWRLAARFSADCEQFVIRIDAKAVSAHTGLRPTFKRRLDISKPSLQGWFQQVETIASSVAMIECLQRHDLAAVNMERLFITLLMSGQPWVDQRVGTTRTAAPGCVRRAEDFIQGHAGEPIRLGDIAAAAAVPARTLQDGFKRFRDYTPMQYLNDVRLERARQRLLDADPGTLVVDVAMESGFLHLGRFAAAYQQRYGEMPSGTLKRMAAR